MSSSDVAISIDKLSKAYTITQGSLRRRTFRDEVMERAGRFVRAPFSGFRAKTETFWALKDVSLEVKRGEVLGLIGRNGAGKSTLLKILSRITEPTSGRALLNGRVGSLLEVGTGFHPELTGRENIYLNGVVLGMSRAEVHKHFDAIVDFAEVEKFVDTPVKRYSSGMYVRLAFAVAAHLEPEILIVDEVLAVGDATFQKKCLGKMGDVAANEGRTVIFVSHNMASIRSLCKTACMMKQGTISLMGDTETCVAEYLNSSDTTNSTVTFRQPPGAISWMKRARILTGHSEGIARLDMGDDLVVEIDFAADRPISPAFSVMVNSGEGDRVVHVDSRIAPEPTLERPRRSGTIRCTFKTLPLTAGYYTISLWLGDSLRDSHHEKECMTFEVVEKDLWGTGRTYSASHSRFWWPAEISIRESV